MRKIHYKIAVSAFAAVLLMAGKPATAASLDNDLTVSDDNALLYKGKPVDPAIQGNATLSVGKAFQLGNTEIALIQDEGAEICPAKFYIVSISAAGLKQTPAFGTCNDRVKIKQDRDSISVSMPGFAGPFNSKSDQAKAAKERHIFVYKNNLLTEDGKEVK